MRRLVPILFGLALLGVVTGIAVIMLLFLGQDWGDALFWLFAAVMIGSAFLVVTMRDIIRCGLAMIVCFGSLAGIYAIIGAPLLAAAQVIVYIGAISVLILFAIMLTQTKDAPSRLVFQTQAVPAAIASIIIAIVIALAIGATDWGEAAKRARLTAEAMSNVLFDRLRAAVRDRQRAAAGRRHRWRLSRQARARRAVVTDSLDAYLVLSGLLFAIGTFGFLARRNAISMLMSIELMLNGVNLAIVAFGAFGVAKAVAGAATPSPDALAAQGSVIALMVMAVAAAEATVGLAIVIAIYRNKKTPLVDEYDAMRQ